MRRGLLLLLLAGPAHAETLAYVEGGGEALDGLPYALVEPGAELRGDRVHVALGAVFRLGERGLRDQDFDEASEYAAVLRRLQVGEEGQSFRLLAGSVPSITLGRGGIVGGLEPSLDPDHGRAGAYLHLTAGPLALSAMAQDVVAARVYGARAELVPWERVHVGATWAIDPRAVLPAGSDVAQVAGADVAVVVLRADGISLSPYVEGAALLGSGAGLSVGVAADLELGGGTLALGAEYRRLGAGHVPRYFDAFYELERHAYPTRRSPPKLAYARASPAGDGMALEARFTAGAFAAHAGVEGRGAGPVSADLGVDVTAGGVSVAARAARRGAVDAGDLIDLTGELWALLETRVSVSGPVYAFATAGQMYHLDRGVRAVGEVSAGIGVIGGP